MTRDQVKAIAAAAAETKERVLQGGRLDTAVPADTRKIPGVEPAALIIGRWYLQFNAESRNQFIGLAKAMGTPVAERPPKALVGIRRLADGYLLVRPCKEGEQGLEITRNPSTGNLRISRLFIFLERNSVIPSRRTVFTGETRVGPDATLGQCLIMNVTTATTRTIEKRPKKPKSPDPAGE